MSYQAVAWWLNHATVKGAPWAVGIVLASHADAEGRNAYPSKTRIAIESQRDPRTVRTALETLERQGWWLRSPGLSPLGTRVWTLQMDEHRFPAKRFPGDPEGEGVTPLPQGVTPEGSDAPGVARPEGSAIPRGEGVTPGYPGAPRPSKPSLEPSIEGESSRGHASTRRDEEQQDSLSRVAVEVVGVLQRGIDGLTCEEPCKAPTVSVVLAAMREHEASPDLAMSVATDTRATAQSQNRAPNIAGLFRMKLAQACNDRTQEAAA